MPPKMNVLVYSGAGVSATSLSQTLFTLRALLNSSYAVETISASALASHPWAPSCALLVMPGGRDTPYVAALGGAIKSIKSYVQGGGSFLGLCAGAYFASNRIEWEVGTPLEVIGDRPLGFYPGTSEGCVYKGFEYQTEKGAHAVEARASTSIHDGPILEGLYYNGGGHFVSADTMESRGVHPILRYNEGAAKDLVAAVSCQVGRGIAVLSHIHFEYSLLLEPAATVLSRTLPNANYNSLESARRGLAKHILRHLHLDVSQESVEPSSFPPVPLPQILTFSPLSPVNGSMFVRAIQKELPNISPPTYYTLGDHNDTFHIHPTASSFSDLVREGRETTLEATELPASFPKTIVVCGENESLPSTDTTPSFNIPLFFEELARNRSRQTVVTTEPRIGDALLYGEIVTSTQTLLDKNPTLLRALPTPLVSLASTQLLGRGRGSNSWVAPPGCLTFSLLLRVPRSVKTSSLVFIQYLFGLAITEGCRTMMGVEAGERVRLKWPNDIYAVMGDLSGKESEEEKRKRAVKIGGILVSTNFTGGHVDVIIGVGLNVLNARPTTSLAQLASSSSAPIITTEKTLAVLLTTFERMWTEFCETRGSFEPFHDTYLERWLHSDQLVTLTTGPAPLPVRLAGLSPDHGLLRTVPERRSGMGGYRHSGSEYVDVQPDGNSFDMLEGLIRVKM